MSSKTRTRTDRATSTTGTGRALRLVPAQPTTTATVRTDAEDALWAALHANPDSTAADLSAAAKIGKSTAQKILVKWEGDGCVTRVVTRVGFAGGGRRAADRWAIADTADAAFGSTVEDGTDTSTDGTPADEGTVQDTAPAETVPDEPTTASADPDPAATVDAPSAEKDVAESANVGSLDPAPEDVQDMTGTTADAVPAQDTIVDAVPETTEPADGGTTPEDATVTTTDSGKDGKPERLAPGALRGMVEDHLRDHPDERFSPTAIAKALGGKSSGAVSNALDKLVADGVAVKTQDKPRRFALAPAQQAAAAQPAN